MPIWKMNFCSRFLRLSVVPRCREKAQIAMCFLAVVVSLLTLARYRDLSDLLRSPIVSHVPPQMSFIA